MQDVYPSKSHFANKTFKSANKLNRSKNSTKDVRKVKLTPNLNFFVDKWLDNIRSTVKPQTYSCYRSVYLNHINKSIGQTAISKINSECINNYLKTKAESGRKSDNSKGLSSNYLKLIIYIIKASLRFAQMNGYYLTPLNKISVPSSRKKEISVFSNREAEILNLYLSQNSDKFKIGILLTLNTGLRLGEICGLKWSDFDFEQEFFTVQRTIQRVKNTTGSAASQLVANTPKTSNSIRIVPIPSFLIKPLMAVKADSAAEFIFSGRNHDFIDPRTYQYKFKKYLDVCGLPQRNFHALRHTFATRCMEAGVDTKTLSEILGHSNINTTMNIYVHPTFEKKKSQIELMVNYYKK